MSFVWKFVLPWDIPHRGIFNQKRTLRGIQKEISVRIRRKKMYSRRKSTRNPSRNSRRSPPRNFWRNLKSNVWLRAGEILEECQQELLKKSDKKILVEFFIAFIFASRVVYMNNQSVYQCYQWKNVWKFCTAVCGIVVPCWKGFP